MMNGQSPQQQAISLNSHRTGECERRNHRHHIASNCSWIQDNWHRIVCYSTKLLFPRGGVQVTRRLVFITSPIISFQKLSYKEMVPLAISGKVVNKIMSESLKSQGGQWKVHE